NLYLYQEYYDRNKVSVTTLEIFLCVSRENPSIFGSLILNGEPNVMARPTKLGCNCIERMEFQSDLPRSMKIMVLTPPESILPPRLIQIPATPKSSFSIPSRTFDSR